MLIASRGAIRKKVKSDALNPGHSPRFLNSSDTANISGTPDSRTYYFARTPNSLPRKTAHLWLRIQRTAIEPNV